MTKIAAIIPMYNGSRYIEAALRSVLAQDRPADEIIVVDDGSDTEDGAEIVRSISSVTRPIQLLFKENGGQGSARNLGVAHSSSDLIAFLDQDDLWLPNHLSRLEQTFVENDRGKLGWVYSNLDGIDESGQLTVARLLESVSETPHPKREIVDCLRGDMFILPGASLIKRDALLQVGGFDSQFVGYEDDDLFLRMFAAGFENVYLNESLTLWRTHSSNTSSTEKMSRSRRLYFAKIAKAYPEHLQRTIIPRFAGVAMQEYVFARARGMTNRAANAKAEMESYAELLPRMSRWRYSLITKTWSVDRRGLLARVARKALPLRFRFAIARTLRRMI